MRTATLTLVCAGLLLLPSGASAQTFAGGTIGTGTDPGTVGTVELGFRVNGTQITVRGTALLSCRRGGASEVEGIGTGPLNPDGTFSVSFTDRRLQLGGNPRFERQVVVTGQVQGDRITGRIEGSGTGGRVRDCQGAFDYVARTAPALGPDAAPPPANGTLIGMTSGKGGPFGFNLRVSADGKRITQLVAGARYTCRKTRPYHETNYSPAIRIKDDGTFRYVERFKIRYTDAVDRVTVTTTGRFVNGGATGTWKARTVARSKRTGQVIDRCRTGQVNWSAALI